MEVKYIIRLITIDHKHIIIMGGTNDLKEAENAREKILDWLKGIEDINPKFAKSMVIVEEAPENGVYVIDESYNVFGYTK